jgi:hypothetical protein
LIVIKINPGENLLEFSTKFVCEENIKSGGDSTIHFNEEKTHGRDSITPDIALCAGQHAGYAAERTAF